MIKKRFLLLFSLMAIHISANAAPWVDTSNIFLRADIQLLADKGHIDTLTSTYPIMWAELSRSLKIIDESKLDEISKNAYWHIKQHLKRANKSNIKVSMNIASDNKRFTSFGDEFRDDVSSTVSMSYMGEQWAGNLEVSAISESEDGDDVRLDGSHFSFFLGNWVFTAGAYDRWWGPGWDTNLALTNNARPMPGVSLTRKSAIPFHVPFTDNYKIPWSATAFMNQFEDDREIENALLFGMRINFKPLDNLEIGVTRFIQWAGDDRPSGLSTFWDAFLGKDLCGEDVPGGCDSENRQQNEPGNQQGGYDVRYHVDWLPHNFSVYTQMTAEDGNSKSGKIFGQKVNSYGIDTRLKFWGHDWLTFVEFTDTYTDCTNPDRPSLGEVGLGDCFSEHFIYENGMRFKQRIINNIYENDSKSIVLGFISQLETLESWELKLRYLELNRDNSDKFPDDPNKGNTVTKVAEDMLMLSTKYQLRKGLFKYTVGFDISHSSFESERDDEVTPNMYFNFEYTL